MVTNVIEYYVWSGNEKAKNTWVALKWLITNEEAFVQKKEYERGRFVWI